MSTFDPKHTVDAETQSKVLKLAQERELPGGDQLPTNTRILFLDELTRGIAIDLSSLNATHLLAGDVLEYNEHPLDRRVRPKMAVVTADGVSPISDAELNGAVLLFNRNDYVLVAGPSRSKAEPSLWLSFKPGDRQRLTIANGNAVAYYVKKGAQPDLDTQIENQQQVIGQARLKAAEARARLKTEERLLEKLMTRLPFDPDQ